MDSAGKKHPLVSYREEHALSQQALAELIGVDRATIWRWENGRNVSDDYLPTVSERTGIPRLVLRPDLAALAGVPAQ